MIRPSGPCPARIMLVGEFPNETDLAQGAPFVGTAGQELSRMLQEAGIMRSQCFITSVIRERPPQNDLDYFIAARKSDVTPAHLLVRDKMVMPCVRHGIDLLRREIEMCQPNLIIAFGNVPLWALTGAWGITSWRGSEMECDLPLALDYKPKVIPVYHPNAILKTWPWRPITMQDLKRCRIESATREVFRASYDFITRPSYGDTLATLDKLQQSVDRGIVKLSVDKETRAGHIACIGLAWSKLAAICIPFMCVESDTGYWTLDEEAEIVWRLYRLLTHPNCQVVGQNFLYDAQYSYRHWHFIPNLIRDTMIAQHCIFSNMPKGLDFLSSMHCEHHLYWKDEGKEWDPKKHKEDQYWEYNCKDAVITYEVDESEIKAVAAMDVQAPHDFQQSLFHPVLETMNRGIRVDTKRRGEMAMELMDEISAREAWLFNVIGRDVSIKSPKQMQEFFYAELGQKPVFNRKTGTVTCNEEALHKIAQREPILRPVIAKILELRSLGVFLSTFVNASLDSDGRMRCSFNIAGTETYRFSSSANAFGSGLNFQNIPKGGETEGLELDLPNIRSLYIPDPGNTFFDIDLSSADLRIVVWESDETEMKRMLLEGLDPYTEIAKEFYHDPSITKKDPRRQKFKSFAHGTNYLGTAKGLAERLGLSIHEAEKTQAWYFNRFPKIKKWQNDLKDQVFKRRMVQNIFGYRCYFFDRIEGNIFNEAAAWIPQSTVGCLINRAYVNIYSNLKEVQILLQVHDSLAGQYPTHLGDWATRRILEESHITLPYPDPLIIPVGIKTSPISWGDCD